MNPPNEQPHAEPMALLATVASAAEAEAMRMELELSGIRVEAGGSFAANVVPLLGAGALGGIPVRVPAAELRRAREVLAARARPRERGILECPRCRSDSIHHPTNARRQMPLLFISWIFPPLFFFLLYIMVAERNREEYQCRTCGHCWVEKRKSKPSRRFLR